jgi:hypothetical protein
MCVCMYVRIYVYIYITARKQLSLIIVMKRDEAILVCFWKTIVDCPVRILLWGTYILVS